MMKYYLELKDKLDDFISENYELRNNLLMFRLGREKLQYRRLPDGHWMSASQFGRIEKSFISQSDSMAEYAQKISTYIPYRVLNQILFDRSGQVKNYLPYPELHKIIDEPAVAINEEEALDPLFRERVSLEQGDRCFVSLGVKVKGQDSIIVEPAIIRTVDAEDERKQYNLLAIRFSSTLSKAKELVSLQLSDIEIGLTPKQAVNNMVISAKARPMIA